MIELAPEFLRGSYPPLITPFREDAVDHDAYARLVERQVASGSHGIVVNGTTAEPSLLTVAERRRQAEVAVEVVAGRIPVVVATGSQSHAETVALTEHAAEIGADGLLIVTPYYLRPPQRGLVAYFTDLAARTDLPFLVYHIPGRAAVGVTVDTLAAIADAAPTFVGIKHAVDDLGFVTDVLTRLGPELRVLVGLEELSFPMLAIGAAGMVNAVGNLVPGRIVELYEAVAGGKLEEARRLHFELYELNRAVFYDTNPIPVKYLMARMGLIDGEQHRLPMLPATAEVAARLEAVADRAGLGLDESCG